MPDLREREVSRCQRWGEHKFLRFLGLLEHACTLGTVSDDPALLVIVETSRSVCGAVHQVGMEVPLG